MKNKTAVVTIIHDRCEEKFVHEFLRSIAAQEKQDFDFVIVSQGYSRPQIYTMVNQNMPDFLGNVDVQVACTDFDDDFPAQFHHNNTLRFNRVQELGYKNAVIIDCDDTIPTNYVDVMVTTREQRNAMLFSAISSHLMKMDILEVVS